jgi:hypothetical protein
MENTYKKQVNKKLRKLVNEIIEKIGKEKNFSKDVVSTSKDIVKISKIKDPKKLLKYLEKWEKEGGSFDIEGLDGGLLFPEIYLAYLRKAKKQRKKPKKIF